MKKNNWICECGLINYYPRERCFDCGKIREGTNFATIGNTTKTYREWCEFLGINKNIGRYLSTVKKHKKKVIK